MKKRLFLMLVAAMACCAGMVGQTRSALRINEVMVENTPEGIADEYGAHHGWIELFNANFAPIEISSIYLTNDSTKPTLYPVPLGDVNTRMPKRICDQPFSAARSTHLAWAGNSIRVKRLPLKGFKSFFYFFTSFLRKSESPSI